MKEMLCLIGAVILAGLSVMDIRNLKINVFIPLVFGVIALIGVHIPDKTIVDSLLGAVIGLFFVVMSKLSSNQIGLGDGLVMIGMGLSLGYRQSLSTILIGFLLIFVFSVILLVLKKIHLKSRLPFIPFYFLAYVSVVYL